MYDFTLSQERMESVLTTVISANGFQEAGKLSSNTVVRRRDSNRHRYNGILSADRLRQMRSLNPFRSFLNEKRIKMKREHPELAARDIVSIVAAIWNGSPETEKSLYRSMVEKERRRIIESWGDESLLAVFDRKAACPRRQRRPKNATQPPKLECATRKAVSRKNEKNIVVGVKKIASTNDRGGFRLPPSLAHCRVSRQVGHSLPRRPGPGRRKSNEVNATNSTAQRSVRPGSRSVRELLKAARAKKAQEEEESQTSQSKNDQYLWDYQSCVQGKNGDYDKEISTAATVAITSGTVSSPANNSLYTPCKACFLPSFIAFDKKLDGEEHRLRLRDSYVRKQLTAVTEELADKKVRDEKVKLSLSKNDQEVTDALLWTDFIYRVCLVNALKSIRVPGFHSAVTTENVLEFLRAAAILVKEKNAKDRRFIGRFKSIMEKLTMPKAPC